MHIGSHYDSSLSQEDGEGWLSLSGLILMHFGLEGREDSYSLSPLGSWESH